MPHRRLEVLHRMRAEIDKVLVPLIQGHERHICLIDPPNYSNVGDSAILLGQFEFIKRHFPRARLSFFDLDSYSERCAGLIEQASIILINGGGNFGDFYPRHQNLRLDILQRFPHKRVIQLPQSITFDNAESLSRSAEIISRHPDFHLIVRDGLSKSFADANFSTKTWLMPDMAFYLGGIHRQRAESDFFCLLRQDKEVAADHHAILEALASSGFGFDQGDWVDEPRTFIRRLDRKLVSRTNTNPRLTWPLMPLMVAVRRRYARDRVDAGAALLARGRAVVTDRLHAHVLCCLMGIPHLVFDSLDGKVSALYRAWSHAFEGATLVSGTDQLPAMLNAVRDRSV